ncbi:MAG: putative toxin-antitoxin system toxin component, PIN family [Ottowia sp.]|uniref:putative toxin-antitoxin system toxin component, PIN family n=1 Tax=Ottowia sp. TaxID=1898956 RepID=UPI0039E25B59
MQSPPIVLDTNLLVSAALLPGSPSAQALTQAVLTHELAFSDDTWDELHEVLHRPRFDRYFPHAGQRSGYLHALARAARWHHVVSTVTDYRDPRDNKFLALALDARATTIVSGDSDLLCLHPWRGIAIVRPSAFVATSGP